MRRKLYNSSAASSCIKNKSMTNWVGIFNKKKHGLGTPKGCTYSTHS